MLLVLELDLDFLLVLLDVVVVEVVVVIKVFVGAAPIDEVVVSISHSTAIISSFLIGLLFLFSSE